MSAHLRILATLACVMVASAAAAEVRISGPAGRPSLDVRVSEAGIWTPSRPGTGGRLLNPVGDRTLDGLPATADMDGGLLLAAWARAVTGELVLARIPSRGAVSTLVVASGPIAGQPHVAVSGDIALVAWQRGDGGGIDAVAWSAHGIGEPVFVQEGALLGVVGTESTVFVVGLDQDGASLVISDTVFVVHPHPVPIPTERLRASLAPGPSPALAHSSNPARVPCLSQTSEGVAVSWQGAPGYVSLVRLGDVGIEGPDEFPGVTDPCGAAASPGR